MRVLVYTAVFGGYDRLHEPVRQDIACDFVCFTDAKMPARVGSWHVVHVPADPALHPRMQAKRFKLLSHGVIRAGRLPFRTSALAGLVRFGAYHASLWIDGSIAIKGPHFASTAVAGLRADQIALFAHPDRDCIYEEADVSSTMVKYEGQRVREQVARYAELGVEPHSGLYACGIVGRCEPESTSVRQFNDHWWRENLDWTYQDQLSVGVALSKAGVSVRTIPGNLWSNQFFDLVPHASDR